jgi:hypothetical protein
MLDLNEKGKSGCLIPDCDWLRRLRRPPRRLFKKVPMGTTWNELPFRHNLKQEEYLL